MLGWEVFIQTTDSLQESWTRVFMCIGKSWTERAYLSDFRHVAMLCCVLVTFLRPLYPYADRKPTMIEPEVSSNANTPLPIEIAIGNPEDEKPTRRAPVLKSSEYRSNQQEGKEYDCITCHVDIPKRKTKALLNNTTCKLNRKMIEQTKNVREEGKHRHKLANKEHRRKQTYTRSKERHRKGGEKTKEVSERRAPV